MGRVRLEQVIRRGTLDRGSGRGGLRLLHHLPQARIAGHEVGFVVGEHQLRRLDEVFHHLIRILCARQRDHDLVAALRLDLGLRHTKRVHSIANDLNRARDGLGRHLGIACGLALQHHLDAALQVEAEYHGLYGHDHGRCRDQPDDDREEEDGATTQIHRRTPGNRMEMVAALVGGGLVRGRLGGDLAGDGGLRDADIHILGNLNEHGAAVLHLRNDSVDARRCDDLVTGREFA